MRDIAPELEHLDAQVIVVGNGTPVHARAFQQQEDIPFALYVDPERQAYEALGMTRRVAAGTFVKSARAILEGHRQSATRGDAHQNGGVLVIDAEGETRFVHISQFAGDHVEPEAIVDAVSATGALREAAPWPGDERLAPEAMPVAPTLAAGSVNSVIT